MRCSCPHCGLYMIQNERGLESRCVCPGCFHTCNACMGTEQPPLSRDELMQNIQLRALLNRSDEDVYLDEND